MKEIEVNDFEYKKAKAPDILTSGGLGPCIAVGAIYCNKGYMAHYSSILFPKPVLEQLLDDLKKDVKDKSKLKIYIAGGSLEDCAGQELVPEINLKEIKEDILDARKVTIKQIGEAGFAGNIRKIRWAEENSTQELTLLLEEQKALYEECQDADADLEITKKYFD